MCISHCSKLAYAVPPENVSCLCMYHRAKGTYVLSLTKQMRLGKIIAKQLYIATSPTFCSNFGRTAN